jgi:acyl dehydratase
MTIRTIHGLADLHAQIGSEVAVSPWFQVAQSRIDQFAEATLDHQWVHVDPARARKASPYGGTIAHGFLTVGLLSHLLNESIEFPDYPLGINYGFNRLRFTGPVAAGARIRARFLLTELEALPPKDGSGEGMQITWKVAVDVEAQERPALVAEWVVRRYR